MKIISAPGFSNRPIETGEFLSRKVNHRYANRQRRVGDLIDWTTFTVHRSTAAVAPETLRAIIQRTFNGKTAPVALALGSDPRLNSDNDLP